MALYLKETCDSTTDIGYGSTVGSVTSPHSPSHVLDLAMPKVPSSPLPDTTRTFLQPAAAAAAFLCAQALIPKVRTSLCIVLKITAADF